MKNKQLRVGRSTVSGRGVFAEELITKDEIVEVCPVIVVSDKEMELLDETPLSCYVFKFGINFAVCLGFGSLYNHSINNNLAFIRNINDSVLEFYALKDIQAGEELFICYSKDSIELKEDWNID